ncbi:hypothetical protein HK104_010119 [Borealophlyctis nickersoniae]|nr:hypothetical protein HK104_010119 [Borealophlyctis nickersoniae]
MAPTDQSQTKPSPAIPYELLRLVVQRSTPTCAARMRRLNRFVGWLITMEDLVKVEATFYWRSLGSAAVTGIRYEKIPPEVTEKIYTALVGLGADPLPKDGCILKWSLVEGHLNVTRAIAAAGVSILGAFDLDQIGWFGDWYPDFRSVVYLVEECGLQDFGCLLAEGVVRGQTKCIQFLLTSGADMRSVGEDDVDLAAERGLFEVLGLLLDMGLEAFPGATEALRNVFYSECIRDKDALPTIKVLIRGGADIVAVVPHIEEAFGWQWWDVVEFLFGAEEFSSELGKEYGLIQGVVRGDQIRIREQIEAGADINAFREAALRLAIVKGKEDMVKLLLDCGADPTFSIWHVFKNMDAQKEMGVAQPSMAIFSLLMDAGAEPRYSMVEKSMKPAYFALFEEFLPLCQQEDLDDLLTTAWKDGNSKAVETLLAAGANAALIPAEERCHNADGKKREVEVGTSGAEPKLEAVDARHRGSKKIICFDV